MSTSKPQPPGNNGNSNSNTNSNGGTAGANSYTRFIPREELQSFSAWSPASLEDPAANKTAPGQSPAGGGVHKAPFSVRAGVAGAQAETKPGVAPGPVFNAPQTGRVPVPKPEAPAPDAALLIKDARQAGYQDGYRDGLAALESFKQAQTAQMAAFMSDQVGTLVSELHQRLESLEQQLSGRIAGVALELARQVVRSEITARPDLVVTVAEEALATLLSSAREVVLRLSPDDFALAQAGLQDHLRTRGARVVADPHVTPGGCLVESDIAVVDASVEYRWHQASAAMGVDSDWAGGSEPALAKPMEVPEGDSGWLDDMNPPGGRRP